MPDIRLVLVAALVIAVGIFVFQSTVNSPQQEPMTPLAEQADESVAPSADELSENPQDDTASASNDAADADDPPTGSSVHVVRMISTGDGAYHFEPHVVRLQPGDTVRWELESGAHTTTAYHPANGDRQLRIPEGAKAWNSGFLTADGKTTFERTFSVEGVYDYFCIPHEGYGMIGTLVVGEAHDGPGLSEPQSNLPQAAQDKLRTLNGAVRVGQGSDE